MNRTLKAIEDVSFPANPNFESLVIVISTGFTFGHVGYPHLVFVCRRGGGCFRELLLNAVTTAIERFYCV